MEHLASKYSVHLYLLFSSSLLNLSTASFIYNCSSNNRSTPNSPFQINLKALLSSLSSHATGSTEFYNTTVGGQNSPSSTVYGLFMCWSGVPHELCRECVANGTQSLASYCLLAKEAIIWFDWCFLRFSNRLFFSSVEEQPKVRASSYANISDNDQTRFTWTLANTLNEVVAEATSSGPAGTKKFATKEVPLPEINKRVYSFAQCTPDLSSEDCKRCLADAIEEVAGCCLGRAGARVIYPSCKLRYELYKFYWDATPPLTPATVSEHKGKRNVQSQTVVVILIAAVFSVMLFCSVGCFLHRRARKNLKAILQENFGNATTSLESLQFDLATIEAATNKFSSENKIGMGGFGGVYKGILPNGQEIAVKRLSSSSTQGLLEFKNEVLLISRLQHRNLVTLLGFCLDQQEKILVYEFVPNKSLDYFLFDSQKHRLLTWSEKQKIIYGTAQGILYLHEHSRLKVIHCDLKPSNILLDDDMNPKISDFGMARMVAINQAYGRTKRVVGTYGYMSPEYAMLGKFSEKSDVFSFGVMILEIITGKRNSSYHWDYVGGLLNYVWKQWSDQTPLNILDPNLKESYSQTEVIKCIQMGLLCVQEDPNERPTMATVASYISSPSVELPPPQEPAFFIHGKKDPNMVAKEACWGQSTSNSLPSSCNEMSTSIFFPR